jgi:hypothetical protein
VIKLLSVDPANYPDAPVEAIRRVLEIATGRSYPRGQKISLRGVGMLWNMPVTLQGAIETKVHRIYSDGNDGSH